MGRGWVGLFCAAVLACGCATSSRPAVSSEQARWEHLCRRMQDRGPAHESSPQQIAALDVDEHRNLEDAAQAALASVVHVYTLRPGPVGTEDSAADARTTSERSGGTGVIITADGIVLTNEHVVRNAAEAWVVLADGSWHAVADVTIDGKLDLAVLRIEGSGFSGITPSPAPSRAGEPVVAIGCTAPGEPASISAGRITETSASLQAALDPGRERKYDELIASSAPLAPGFSGGPLLDAQGRFIGLNVAASSADGEPRGYAIPFDEQTRAAVARLAGMESDPPSESPEG